MLVSEVIRAIEAFRPVTDPAALRASQFNVQRDGSVRTADGIKYGNPAAPCRGVVTTVWASLDAIGQAARLGANLIVTSSPTFFSPDDHAGGMEGDAVFDAMKALLDRHGIVVYRLHDALHGYGRGGTDLVHQEFARLMGWAHREVAGSRFSRFVISPINGKVLGRELIGRLKLNGIRVVGKADITVTRVMLGGYFSGVAYRETTDRAAVSAVAEFQPHVLLPLEAVDYTVRQYFNDAARLGFDCALFELGNFNIEAVGVQPAASLVRRATRARVPVHALSRADGYSYVTRKFPIAAG